ncbi:MAG: hypothetical protein F9K32_03140 [Desulfobulbaceae bacterium]|nr:MAG: hypothetical protein F9K32_03140 [Desulfobulbaceae bacterium]
MDPSRGEDLAKKLSHLSSILEGLEKVAIAYSGGVDSTLLLYFSVQILGTENVLALYGESCLTGPRRKVKAESFFRDAFQHRLELRKIPVDPLAWQGVAENTNRRCYYCKRGLYQRFLSELFTLQGWHLADGTNVDDSTQYRPGTEAIRQLRVATPLLAAGLTKDEIRFLAGNAGLPNHAEPSDSCLATRIETGIRLTPHLLERVDLAESVLDTAGFSGTRFRIARDCVNLEIREQDMERFCCRDIRSLIQQCADELALGKVFLNVTGR